MLYKINENIQFLMKKFNLVSLLLVGLPSLLLAYTFYKSEIVWQGKLFEYYFQYYIFSTTLLCLSFLSFFLNNAIKKNILIILFSTLIGSYIVEGIFLFKSKNKWGTDPKDDPYIDFKIDELKKKNIEYNLKNKFEFYVEQKKLINNIVVTVPPKNYLSENYELFPLSGVSNSKTINCNESGFYSEYISDRYGFNNPDYEWNNKEIEYLIIGDSFAHGACVNRPDDIASQLREISGSSVINLGYGGNGTLLEFATLKEYFEIRKFKNVIWIFYPNDFGSYNAEIKNKILKKYIENPNYSQELHLRQNEIDLIAREMIEKKTKGMNIEKKIYFHDILKFLKLYNVRRIIQKRESIINYNIFETIKLAEKFAKKNSANFYFVYIPNVNELKKNYNSNYYNKTLDYLLKNKINVIDIKNFINSFDKPNSFYPFEIYKTGDHFSENGYKLISNKIYNEIKKLRIN